MTAKPKRKKRSASSYVESNALSDTTIETTATENPITGAVFSAIPSKNLSGAVVLKPLPAVENASLSSAAILSRQPKNHPQDLRQNQG